MKLNKYEINELLYRTSKDNPIYGLVMKIAYIYAKNISEVGNLQTKDINYTENTITFHVFNRDYKPIEYPLHESIISELKKVTEDKKDEEYIFDEYYPHEKTRKHINNYLIKASKIKGLEFLKLKGLTSQDFRILRGQHLYQDGVRLPVIKKLYAHTKLSSTEAIIDYKPADNEIMNLNDVLNDYTDLNMFCQWDYCNYNNYYCTFKDSDAIIEVENKNVELVGDKIIREKLENADLSKQLSSLKQAGDYCFINGVKVLKQ